MSVTLSDKDLVLWQEFYDAYYVLYNAKDRIRVESTNLAELFRHLVVTRASLPPTFELAELLTQEELKQVFEEVLSRATAQHIGQPGFEKLVLSLPREWLIDNIEKYAEPVIQEFEDFEVYMYLLSIYRKIDPGLTRRLAERAAAHSDPDVRDRGIDFLDMLDNSDD
jgi:hypothetical protein